MILQEHREQSNAQNNLVSKLSYFDRMGQFDQSRFSLPKEKMFDCFWNPVLIETSSVRV